MLLCARKLLYAYMTDMSISEIVLGRTFSTDHVKSLEMILMSIELIFCILPYMSQDNITLWVL